MASSISQRLKAAAAERATEPLSASGQAKRSSTGGAFAEALTPLDSTAAPRLSHWVCPSSGPPVTTKATTAKVAMVERISRPMPLLELACIRVGLVID